jgi:hypothetical protein
MSGFPTTVRAWTCREDYHLGLASRMASEPLVRIMSGP